VAAFERRLRLEWAREAASREAYAQTDSDLLEARIR